MWGRQPKYSPQVACIGNAAEQSFLQVEKLIFFCDEITAIERDLKK
jgi:hypothetical protein